MQKGKILQDILRRLKQPLCVSSTAVCLILLRKWLLRAPWDWCSSKDHKEVGTKSTAELKNCTHLTQFLKIIILSEKLFSWQFTRMKYIQVFNKPKTLSATCFVGIMFGEKKDSFVCVCFVWLCFSFERIKYLELVEVGATLQIECSKEKAKVEVWHTIF